MAEGPTSHTLKDIQTGADLRIFPSGAAYVSGDIRITDPIVIGTINVSVDISGDTTVVPKAGEVWPVSQSGPWVLTGPVGSGDVAIVDGSVRSQKATVYPTGSVRVSGDVRLVGSAAGDGSILDGVDTGIKATVKDYTNSNPLAVVLVNVSGDAYNTGGGSSGGDGAILDGVNSALKATVYADGALRVSGDVVTFPRAGSVWPTRQQDVVGVQIVGGSVGGTVGLSGDVIGARQNSAWSVGISGDATVVQKAGEVWNVRQQGVVGVQVLGGQVGGSVGVSGDVSTLPKAGEVWSVRQATTWSTGVSGDVSTFPRGGEIWPTRQQDVVGVQVVGGAVGGTVGLSGDVVGARQNSAWSVGISGDVLIRERTYPFSGIIGVYITGGREHGTVGVSGDVSTLPKAGEVWPVRQATTWSSAVSGDVSTFPRGGDTWPVKEQSVTGIQIVGGGVGGTVGLSGDVVGSRQNSAWSVGVSGDVLIRERSYPFSGNVPVYIVGGSAAIGASGDNALVDGADRTIKATVRDYTNSNPLAVVPTNTSGDSYGFPSAPLLQHKAGRITSAGSNSIVAAVSGRRIKVVSYSLQADGDNARGFFASGASGDQLTTEWELASREGVVKQLGGGRDRGFLFATAPGAALSFESSSTRAMKYDLEYHVEDAS